MAQVRNQSQWLLVFLAVAVVVIVGGSGLLLVLSQSGDSDSSGRPKVRATETKPVTDCRQRLGEMMDAHPASPADKGTPLVPEGPSAGIVCRYESAAAGTPEEQALKVRRQLGQAAELAAAFNKLPAMKMTGDLACAQKEPVPPVDVVLFRYSSGEVRVLQVMHECLVTDNRRAAKPDKALHTKIDAAFR